ncbi:MAG: hypothetical protein JWP29_3542 [Rhodoferax sp.]|nr:hypothetical protein [Rhodoferax sp.]
MAQANRETVEIGDNIFTIKRFEPLKSLEVLGDLQKHLLGPMASVLSQVRGASDVDTATQAFTAAVTQASGSLDGKTLTSLARMLLNPEYVFVQADGAGDAVKLTEGVQNRVFADVGEMVELLVQIVVVNYAKVFTAGVSRIGLALKDRTAMSLAN